jgi:hypothetical protein
VWVCGGCGGGGWGVCWDARWPSSCGTLVVLATWVGLVATKGCSNNNYASREKCNKCGQPKATGALPSQQGLVAPSPVSPAGMAAMGLNMNMAMALPLGMPGPLGMPWPWPGPGAGGLTGGVPAGGSFRVGDWICSCGFHNYSSRSTVSLSMTH